ncbi:hypothetical protein GDO81_007964 [Engystomops pustulosus]|uniref:Midasin n=1 Tax=Engystomops pustulosus TaxID=76066 RepID=A0AAV7CB27_ENGPU|nr:hypothetical protein GDO81_007964 [Engystomops pustulosus]
MEHFQLGVSGLGAVAQKSGGELSQYLSKQLWTSQDRESILSLLAQLLLDKECTLLIGRQLRPLLLDLLERNAECIKAGGQVNHDLHERLCVAMSRLIASHPDVLPFALRYFQSAPPVFNRLFLESCDSNTVRYGRRRMKLRDLMEAAYRFLQHDEVSFQEMWDWSVCVPLLKSHDLAVRWYTSHCLSMVTCMSDENRETFLNKLFGTDELINFKLQLLDELQGQNVKQGLLLTNPEISLWCKNRTEQYTQGQIVSGDLCSYVAPVCGIILSKKILYTKEQEVPSSPLVLVETTCRSLRSLAHAVSYQNAVLLEGPIGCGKTALVEHLARVTGRSKPPHLLKVQLGDQTDSKMLLGMYRCTDIPGEFVWQPGTLTQAVANGHWILLEDIDYAPLDVISVLISVLENGHLIIPGRGDCIKVCPGFQLFATRRLHTSSSGSWYRPQNSHACLLDKYWTKIHLDNMNRNELKEVLQQLFPNLELAIEKLLDIYVQLTGDKHHSLPVDGTNAQMNVSESEDLKTLDKRPSLEGRGLSLRDLLKWSNRIVYSFDSSSVSSALNIFNEALDCFTAMLSSPAVRLKMAEVIGSKLNISKQKAEFYCRLYKPEIVVRELDVSVGRVEMLRKQTESVHVHRDKITFAATRPSSILIEQIAVCVNKAEPVLLVGETGTGKTSTIQYLAHVAGQRLRIVNMNQQSDTADLLGGYKPVDQKLIWLPLREGFEELFAQTFSRKQNSAFLGHINTCYKKKRWQDLLKLMQHVLKNAMAKVQSGDSETLLKEKWEAFSLRINQAQQQMRMTENAVLFAFVEGTLAQAVKKGEWILLDEINLAAAETLECLCGLLEGSSGSLVLLDRGDTEPLIRHPDFRLFACMNPATDVGKRNLPPGIRNRFTELYVEELESENDLQILITDYLRGLNVNKSVVQGIICFYLMIRKKSVVELMDGTGHRPHFSLRTLCRALRYAAANPCNNIQRSLHEGFCLSFLTQLDRASHSIVQSLICRYIVPGNIKALLKQPLPEPLGGRFVQIEGYWIPVGDKDPAIDESYILTSSVKLNLRDLVRVVSAGNHPVLIQGETSVGKTSLIRWLAYASGNNCVRINNHEHTDIQEYIGCYTSDESGKLVFQEGVLIHAMRKGYWIILDELNLAPTDVLEALNRLLDDNRELFITETQEVVKAHPRFMLFATQNPPGLYGGRKVLSRAFRNRFVELHYDELPSAELETILHKRCCLPPSYCTKLVAVMSDLQSHRRGSSVFAGKYGFITLRDLFRWAERYRLSEQTEKDYDWLQHLANDGYLLLAGRVRKQEEVDVISRVLKKCFKKEVLPEVLFSRENMQKQLGGDVDQNFSHVVWTYGMRRLAVLVGRALEFGEPVLLVGDTGCGKTTICQLFAALRNQRLYTVNCHQHMETSDFLGGLRPVRHRSKDKMEDDEDDESSKLFEWHDGPLVLAMREDGFFLLDEISLADDSVLERLNSVLEVEKTLVLAEKGSRQDDDEVELLTAGSKFQILSTMNPGGDFGKKELSPALRNRFTEIWCPQSNDRCDLVEIIKHNLNPEMCLSFSDDNVLEDMIMDFIEWLTNQEFGRRCILSIRDVLSWVNFMNVTVRNELSQKAYEGTALNTVTALIHAACLVYIDGLGSGTTSSCASSAVSARQQCMQFLHEKLSAIIEMTEDVRLELQLYEKAIQRKMYSLENLFGIHPFYITRGPAFHEDSVVDYALESETTSMNAQRLLRAMQLNKPILLEGSPGVGKTSLVTALAKASGNHLVRINLSEQTDVTDLFGTDLPIEGGKGGEFSWRDGPLLSALKAGHWIVLDELNLASQSVLEGLNACFDHRAEVYIPELGMSFQVQHEKTKIFGCQNPFHQGGGRKGLPRSFLNRFTQVFVDQLSPSDMQFIANSLFPTLGEEVIGKMVAFNNQVDLEVTTERKWGQKGGPWEFNLRDIFRWCHLMLHDQSPGSYNPSQHVFLVYGERMRSKEDRQRLISVYLEVFGKENDPYLGTRHFHISPQNIQVGFSVLPRGTNSYSTTHRNMSLLHHSLQSLEPVMKCVELGWMVILVGPAAAGKSSLIQLLALLTGNKLNVMAMNSAMDTTELLGGFEQADINRPWQQLLEQVWNAVVTLVRDSLLATEVSPDDTEILLRCWSNLNLTHKPRSKIDGGHGISTDVLNKLETVLMQIQRMNGKLNSFTKSEFAAILENVRNFKDQLLHSVEGQSSGTFEWVDGMLVQSLQAGDWLLMDNVNFCSSSVLDRLNALLEPGGVLTVSERGVIDGTTPTITPHPNFRLFMTMDPSHGEISRAMRNRGVELFISEDGHDTVIDLFDMNTLLNSLGLVGDNLCNALINVHKEISDTVIGSPCSNLSYLLHAGVLIHQHLQRGIDLEQAFQNACSEVFVYSQPTVLVQQQVQDIIKRHLCALKPTQGGCLLSIGLWPDKVPDAIFSAEDSVLSTILRDGQVLLYILNRHCLRQNRKIPLAIQDLQLISKSSNIDNLNFNALEMENVWMDDILVVQHSVQLIIEKSSSLDWNLRMRWLCQIAKQLPSELDHVCTEIEAGAHALSRFYSSPLSEEIKSVMKLLYTSRLGKVFSCLRWRDRFRQVSENVGLDRDDLALLTLHWNWVAKRSVKQISEIFFGNELHRLSQEVQSLSENIQDCLSATSSQSPASIKLLQKVLGKPLPFKEDSVVQCVQKLKAIGAPLAVIDLRPVKQDSAWQLEIFRLKAACLAWETKYNLLQAWISILQANYQEDIDSDKLTQSVELLRSQIRKQGILLGPGDQSEDLSVCEPLNQECLAKLSSQVQMWPGMEYLMILWQYKMITDLLSHSYYARKNIQSDLNQLVAFCLGHTSVSVEQLRAFCFLSRQSVINSGDVALLWSELISNVLSSFWHSTITTDPDYWSSWKIHTNLEDTESPQSLMELSMKGPGILNRAVLSKCIFEVLTGSSNALPWNMNELPVLLSSRVSLGEGAERLQQLHEISSVLWTNMAFSSLADFRNTDARFQGLLLYHHFVALKDLVPKPSRGIFAVFFMNWNLEWKTRNLSCSLLTEKSLMMMLAKTHSPHHIRALLQRIQKLKAVIYNLSKKQAYRPASPTYNTLYQDVHNYLNSIGKMSSIQDFATRLLKALSGKGTKSRQGILNLLSEEVTWQRSQQQFRKRLSEEYSLYPDVVTPLQAAVLQIQHGIRVIASELYVTMNSSLISPSKISNLISSLLAFPSTSEAFPTYFSHADSLCSVSSLDILKSLKKLSQKYPCKDRTPQGKDLSSCLTKEHLLVNGLLYLSTHVLSKGEMDQKSLELFRHICQAIINEWDEQEESARIQEQQESSLYKYKSKSLGPNATEDELEEREFRMRFPVYDQDFADITEQSSLDDPMETQGSDGQVDDQSTVSQSSVNTVMLVHQQLCLSVARSLWYQHKPSENLTKDYLNLFLSCYQTIATIIKSLYPLLGAEVNDHLVSSHLLASTLLHNTVLGSSTSDLIVQHEGPYDFYQHPNIQQVRQCQGVLSRFNEVVNKLLGDWPDHPALAQLVVIIDRIQGFPLSSPIAKFLNGLEILLAKSQDWEENASRDLSLRKNLDEITHLIIQWRKLELNCWSLSLDNALKRHSEKSFKRWFSIYQLIEDFLQVEPQQENDEETSLQSLTKTLEAFIEGSSLGEFPSRLHMLLVFHCHVLLVPQASRKVSLCSHLWNLYHYYKQFLPSVEARISELRKPVEKELKLHSGEDIYSVESLQCRLPKLTKRMRHLCSSFIKKSSMPTFFENLNTFTDGIIESIQELQNLTIDQSAEKEKQRSEAKHILMQKQRALAELFKMLSKTGLSYRRGIAWMRNKDNQDILGLRPLDLHTAFAITNSTQEINSELFEEITTTWNGCQKYFYKSVARNAKLMTALLNPAKELGLGNIERCKGFSGHLLKILMKQRSSLTTVTEQLVILRNLSSRMQEINTRLDSPHEYKIAFPPQNGMHQWLDRLQNLAMQCSIVLEQLSWLLECCPAKSAESPYKTCEESQNWTASLNVPSPAGADWLPKVCTIRRSDNDWQQLNDTITKMLSDIKATKTAVDTIQRQPCETPFYSWENFETCSSALDNMQQMALDLRELELLFILPETEVKEAAQHITFLKSIHFIREEIRVAVREFTLWKSRLQAIGRAKRNQESDEKYVKDFSDNVETAIKNILFAVQKLVEMNEEKKPLKSSKTEEEVGDLTGDSLQEGLITKFLTEDLWHDLKSLDVQTIISTVSELLERLKNYGEDCIKDKHTFFNQCCGLLVRLLPLLSSYSDLLLFYLTVSLASHRATGKLLSILTFMFTELAQKGFCLPKELIEDPAGEGATEFHDYEGGGIGEGEGMKDVSDKIENEDQVEDTLKKDQEKDKDNPDDKSDVKEEDNAIEMSEDFDGKMQDGDQEKQDEDEKSTSEEDDLDKQMGDLGDADADKLDERLWGDDDDDEDDDGDSDKGDETGPGMDMGESQLVAKDDNQNVGDKGKDKNQDSGDETKEEQEEENRKDKIHEQIDEREYDENETDPYHGKQDTNQEPEALDLPDDLNLETDEGKASEDEKDEDKAEGQDPFDIQEKPMDVNEESKDQEENKGENIDADTQDVNEPDQELEGQDEQKDISALEEQQNELSEDESGENKTDPVNEEEQQEPEKKDENGLPTDTGLQPQNEEEKDICEEEELPDSDQRMEHDTCGQTAEDNLQSDTAAELAGAASEKDEAKEEHGTGTADASQSEGHTSKLMAHMALEKQTSRPTQSIKRKPGQSDDDRTLGDYTEQVHKRLKTIESSSEMDDQDKQTKQQAQEAEAYEHIDQGSKFYDAQTYDTANKEQEKSIPTQQEEKEESTVQEDMDMELQEDECLESINVEELKPRQPKSRESITQGPMEHELEVQGIHTEDEVHARDSEPTNTDLEKNERSLESSIHTVWDLLRERPMQTPQNLEELRKELEKQLEEWYTQDNSEEEKSAAEMWQSYLFLTAHLSQQLCEQLRLILEPTKAAKLKGDYRTGKRLNMRKVIPYIASQFRKDKIWLRRTKPSKREYQICLALDDSSSMVDNHSKQLAYESLAVIGNALTLLEVGQIAVYSFGENVKLLHPFHEQFSEQSGSRILSQCKFQQKKTLLAQFLESCVPMFAAAQQMSQSSNLETAQLLLIVSDGRGLFVEGKDRVTRAVKAARNANIFIIFIILDNPTSKDSILDIKVPIFTDPKEMPKMISYMEQFPFPFYIILRDVNTLPETLSDALRQWFELVTTSEHM